MVLFLTSNIARSFAAKRTVSVTRISIEGYLIASAAKVGTEAEAEAAGAAKNRHGYLQRRVAIPTKRIKLRNTLQSYGTSSYRFLVVDGKKKVSRRRLFTTNSADEPLSSIDNGSTSNDDCNSINRRQKRIPSPTWSIADLELTSTHPPLPQNEFERLARLVLIDVSSKNNENNNDNYNDDMDSLRQDLGNMLHMIQHVTEYEYYPSPTGKYNNEHFPTSENNDIAPTCGGGSIYDTVRGVKAIPLRKGIDDDPLQDRDATQAREVWESFLRPKTIRKGGSHVYFAIETNENKLCK